MSKHPIDKMVFDVVECTPQKLFDHGRKLGSPTADNYGLSAFELRHQNTFNREQQQPKSFSYDFNAMEILGDKHYADYLHTFKLPITAPTDVVAAFQNPCTHTGHPANGPGKELVRRGGQRAYQGHVEDWFNLLNQNHVYTATGVSDTHDAEFGYAKTYIYIPPHQGKSRDLHPGSVNERDITEAMRNQQAVLTSGPMLSLLVIDDDMACDNSLQCDEAARVGGTVFFRTPKLHKPAAVEIRLQTNAFTQVEELKIYINGNDQTAEKIVIPQGTNAEGRDFDDDYSFVWTHIFNQDSYIVVEALSSQNMFPVHLPDEEPAKTVGAVLAVFGPGLGLQSVLGSSDGIHGSSFTITCGF